MKSPIQVVGSVLATTALLLSAASVQAEGASVGANKTTTIGANKSVTLQSKKANLQVQTIAIAPVKNGYVKPGSNLRLYFVVVNKGQAPSGRLSKYSIQCKIVKGTKCPIASTTRALPSLKPGQSKSITLISAQQAKPGEYRIYISAKPRRISRARSVRVKVGPFIKLF